MHTVTLWTSLILACTITYPLIAVCEPIGSLPPEHRDDAETLHLQELRRQYLQLQKQQQEDSEALRLEEAHRQYLQLQKQQQQQQQQENPELLHLEEAHSQYLQLQKQQQQQQQQENPESLHLEEAHRQYLQLQKQQQQEQQEQLQSQTNQAQSHELDNYHSKGEKRAATVPEPTCEELRTMWRYSKRQSRAVEGSNELPLFKDPFNYNIWEADNARLRSSTGYQDEYQGTPRSGGAGGMPVYGKLVHKAPAGSGLRNGMPHKAFEELSSYYGTVSRHAPAASPAGGKGRMFRHGASGSAPQAGKFNELKQYVISERAQDLEKMKGDDASQREKRSPDNERVKVKVTMEQQLLKLDEAINQSLGKELTLEPSLFHNGEPIILTEEEISLIQYPKLQINLSHKPGPLPEDHQEQVWDKVRTKRIKRSLNNDDPPHMINEDSKNLKKEERSPQDTLLLLKNALENYAVHYMEVVINVKENDPKTSPSQLKEELQNYASQMADSLLREIEEQQKFEPRKLHTLTALYSGDSQVNNSPKCQGQNCDRVNPLIPKPRSLTSFYETVQFQDHPQKWSSPIGDHQDLQAQ